MADERERTKKLSRRTFLKGTAVGTAAVAGAGAPGSCAPAAPAGPGGRPSKWAKEADGVIEGWHGDGNFARPSLMYAFSTTHT